MDNVKAILLSNTDVDRLTVENFNDMQKELHEPILLFIQKDTYKYKLLKYFNVVAEDLEELKLMFRYKVFYTSSIPEGEYGHQFGALFYGVGKDLYKNKKKRSTANECLKLL